MSEGKLAIRVRGLRVDYGRGEGLQGVDVDLPFGSVTALLGKNGAGKSTLIDACLGLHPRARGEMAVLGGDPRRCGAALRRLIGYVEADPHFESRDTPRSLLNLRRRLHRDWSDDFAAELVERFGLPLDVRCCRLSRGKKTQLALICALGHRPPLLLLDEPFDGLDVGLRHDILAEIIGMVDGSRAILLASHDLDEIERVADRAVVLGAGRVLMQSDFESVRGEHRSLEESFLTITNEETEPQPC